MTVRLIPPSVGYHYEGLSTDDKPTGVVINSTFREIDTGLRYLTPDGTNWYVQEISLSSVVAKVVHPFGKGALTTDGVQYSAEVSGITHTTFGEVAKATVYQLAGMVLESIELGLTAAIKSSSTAKKVYWKWQGSDNGTDWEDLIAEQIRAADASVYADRSISGRFAPTGNFLAAGSTFQIRFVIKAEDANETVAGKVKNSCYVLCRYRRS